jgi:hypothetical protein
LLVGVIMAASGCSDRTMTGPAPVPSLAKANSASGLLQCKPLAADSTTQVIGPEGGAIKVGRHNLLIPPGAVADSVAITAIAPSDTVRRVSFQPEGLVFQVPAVLTISYASCQASSSIRIAYTTDALEILEYEPSIVSNPTKMVVGQIAHFSNYALSW